jgi:beta-glucosidase
MDNTSKQLTQKILKMKLISVLISKLPYLLIILCITQPISAQYESDPSQPLRTDFPWPEGARVAISLSFDDGRFSQIDQCVPLLDKYGVKGTFYISTDRLEFRKDEWKAAAENGHDLGNHTLKHGCSGNFVWSRKKALEDYSLKQLENEILIADNLIELNTGVKPRSFAYPCGQTFVGKGAATTSYVPVIATHFQTGRLWMSEAPNDPSYCDFSQLTGIKMDGKSFHELKTLIESEKCAGKWLVLVGHETLDTTDLINLVTSHSTLDSLCRYALDPANKVWIDNVKNIASFIETKRKEDGLAKYPYQNPYLSTENRVSDLLSRMTIREKIGQMNMPAAYVKKLINTIPVDSFDMAEGTSVEANPDLERRALVCEKFTLGELVEIGPGGGFFAMAQNMFQFEPSKQAMHINAYQKLAIEKTRLGIPLLLSEEGTHGACVTGATVFPEGLALGSSFNMDLIENIYSAAAEEARAIGVHQLFTLVIEPIRDPRMGRNEEAFSEDTYLTSRIAEAIVKGCQGEDISAHDKVVAGLAHFPGQSQGVGGLEYGTMEMSERIFRSVFLPPWEAGIKNAGALGAMVTHPVIDAFGGLPATANKRLLTDVLRKELNFNGVLLGEGNSLGTILFKKVAADQQEAGLMALHAGLDVAIAHESGYMEDMLKSIDEGKASIEAIDNAVRNILTQKFRLGLFENPYVEPEYADIVVNSEKHQELALQAAREGIVLLKNEKNLLPLQKNLKRIAVIGPNAHDKRNQLGDYIAHKITQDVTTVLEGIKQKVSKDTEVLYVKGCNVMGNELNEIREARKIAARSDVAIIVVGEGPQNVGEKRDVASLDLLGKQNELIKAVYETGTPTIVVLINGRPLSVTWIAENVPALVEAWNCGEKGGLAIADVLFGDYNPDGRLAITVPRHVGQLPVYYNHTDQKEVRLAIPGEKRAYVDMTARPLYEFGYGLSYTDFTYEDLKISPAETGPYGFIDISCKVMNTGKIAGKEVVQLYLNDEVSSVETPAIELRGFAKIALEPGESKTVRFRLSPYDLSLINANLERVVEPGTFEVMVGRSCYDIKLKGKFQINP